MALLTRVLLDVLKPHDPSVLDLARALSDVGGYRVRVRVLEMDKNTETLEIEIAADAIDFPAVVQVIADLGASLHSIDEVDVEGASSDAATD
ncbi:MAG: DUF211 domain-containing protein [Oceanospirillaceae bacterium]|nr:DUF211 domain-containing protein [Oceanospirillaceae bacterium]